MQQMADRLLYRVPEAADAIGVSRARAYELIAAGEIPSIRLGSSIRVPVEELRSVVARKVQEQQKGAA